MQGLDLFLHFFHLKERICFALKSLYADRTNFVGEMQKSHLLLDDQTIPETTVDYRALLMLDS